MALKRRKLTDQPDPCADASGCCPSDTICTSAGCCPDGEEQCGSGNYCYDPTTSICCGDGSHCPLGETCIGDGRCCPSGQEACGSLYCYDPNEEFCCSGGQGSCDLGLTCCDYECCTSEGSCGGDGFCSANVCTETSTYASTSYATFTATITEIATPDEEEEALEFFCEPITATNSLGDTLELGDDCLLTLSPAAAVPSTTGTLHAGRREAEPTLAPAPRAENAECAYTSTSIVTSTVFTQTTFTTTVTETALSESFSCPPMSVTNAAGDELSLDSECSLSFSPGPSGSTLPTAVSGGGSSGSGGSGGSSGGGRAGDGAASLVISTSLIGGSFLALAGALLL